ncbi:MAG: DUF1684 domain-containing protein [Promethearchaeota archaeon]
MNIETYIENIKEQRAGKDRFFKEHYQSPIPPQEQPSFSGLQYFSVDPAFRFELPLTLFETPEKFESADSAGNIREFYRFGKFQFNINDKDVILHAYKSDLSENRLFIPFKDATNGNGETYGAGRYLDMEEARDQTATGDWIVDFNKAYNPFCAYNHGYACALTPYENHLKISIRAGEKVPHNH